MSGLLPNMPTAREALSRSRLGNIERAQDLAHRLGEAIALAIESEATCAQVHDKLPRALVAELTAMGYEVSLYTDAGSPYTHISWANAEGGEEPERLFADLGPVDGELTLTVPYPFITPFAARREGTLTLDGVPMDWKLREMSTPRPRVASVTVALIRKDP